MRPGNQVEKRTLETDSNSSRVKLSTTCDIFRKLLRAQRSWRAVFSTRTNPKPAHQRSAARLAAARVLERVTGPPRANSSTPTSSTEAAEATDVTRRMSSPPAAGCEATAGPIARQISASGTRARFGKQSRNCARLGRDEETAGGAPQPNSFSTR